MNAISKAAHATRRVVFVHLDLRFGGVEKQLLYLLRGLDASEFELHLVLCEDCGEMRAALPGHIIVHSLGRRLSRASWLPVVLLLSRCLRRLRPDCLVSVHVGLNVATVAAARIAGLRRPVVGSFMGVIDRGRMDWLRRPFIARMDAVRCVSDSVSAGVRASYGSSVRTVTVPDAVDLSLIDQQAVAQVDHDWIRNDPHVPVAVTASRLVRSKRVDTVLRAVAPLARSGRMRLIVLGGGPERSALEALAAQLEIAESVSFQGYVDNPYAYFSRCQVFVFASESEGLGSVLLEAMACRVPIVTTRFAGTSPAMLKPSLTCLSVAVGDHARMTHAISTLVADDALRSQMVQRARCLVENDFDVTALVRNYGLLLNSLLDGKWAASCDSAVAKDEACS